MHLKGCKLRELVNVFIRSMGGPLRLRGSRDLRASRDVKARLNGLTQPCAIGLDMKMHSR
jgi:hypothetical protein